MTYVVPIKRNFIRTWICPSDEANSNNQRKNTHERRRDVVQTPCPRNSPRPCNQNEGSGDTRQCRVCNGKSDTSSSGVSRHILVILRVNRCQNNPCAQCNSNPHCAIDFALTLACWRTVRPSSRTRSIRDREGRTSNKSCAGLCKSISDRVQRIAHQPMTPRSTALIVSQHEQRYTKTGE
jgi:hypothetical protein